MFGQPLNIDKDISTSKARKIDLNVGRDCIGPMPKTGLKLGAQKDVSIKTGSQ